MTLEVPTHAFALPEGVDPAALLSFLGDRFDIVADPASSVTYTVVDTADRRLGAEGLDLALEADRAGNVLVLHDGAGSPPVRGSAGRHRRWLAGHLPKGPFRDRLGPVIDMRALLPLARVQVDVQALRVLNADAKTVVRLRLATHAALDAGPEPRPLTPRLEVSGVLGYPRPLARVVTVLTTEAGLVEPPSTMADEAVAASGGDPRGIRTKVKVPLQPDDRTDKAAVRVLRDLAGMVEANLPGTLADHDTEFLHDLRVAVRRSRSVLREMKGAFPPDELARQRDALKWIQAITGPTRDLDVQLLDWDGLLAGLPDDRHAALAPVRTLLARHRAAALRGLKRELRGPAISRRVGGLPGVPRRQARLDRRAPRRQAPDRRGALASASARCTPAWSTWARPSTTTAPPTTSTTCASGARSCATCSSCSARLWSDDVVKPMVRSLKGLQDVLGTHQDREVQADHLRDLADELAGQVGGPEALLVLGVLVDRLDAEQHEARARFAEAFADFDVKPQRELVQRTFG